jgi:hypothetical protein
MSTWVGEQLELFQRVSRFGSTLLQWLADNGARAPSAQVADQLSAAAAVVQVITVSVVFCPSVSLSVVPCLLSFYPSVSISLCLPSQHHTQLLDSTQQHHHIHFITPPRSPSFTLSLCRTTCEHCGLGVRLLLWMWQRLSSRHRRSCSLGCVLLWLSAWVLRSRTTRSSTPSPRVLQPLTPQRFQIHVRHVVK